MFEAITAKGEKAFVRLVTNFGRSPRFSWVASNCALTDAPRRRQPELRAVLRQGTEDVLQLPQACY